MKIMHLLESPHFSGAENVVCQIIGMMKNQPDIEMFYSSRDGQIREALKERDILFAPINKLSVLEVKRVIAEHKPHIIHAHDMRASFIAAIACGNIPLISHIHNNSFKSRGISTKSIAYFFATLKIKHIFWVSDSAYCGYMFYKYIKKKSEVLYNIIDIDDLYKKMKNDKKTYNYDIVFLGRMSEPKNLYRLLRVIEKIRNIRPCTKVAIIGTGELEKEIHTCAKKMGLYDYINFLGFQSNPYKMLYDAKAMIMTSLWEGTPMCALEAMALGVPIVSTPTDGLCNVVVDGETGFLSDDDNMLAKLCCDLCDDKILHEEMSKKSFNRAQIMMDINRYQGKILKIYKMCDNY